MMKTSLLFIAMFAALIALPAGAQTQPPAPVEQQQIKPEEKNPFSAIPDEFFEEAEEVMDYCAGSPSMNQYYNCYCVSMRFLNARIKNPMIPGDQLVQNVVPQCIDASGAAGVEYSRCLTSLPLRPLNSKPEDYCKCFANTYAGLFEKYQIGISSKAMVELQKQAYMTCYEPAATRQLNP